MLTTRDLVLRLLADIGDTEPCPEGATFIDTHPDPFEAITVALAQAVDPLQLTEDAEFYSWAPDGRREPGAFLRYLASSNLILGREDRYGDWRAPGHLQKCADALREWVLRQTSEVQS